MPGTSAQEDTAQQAAPLLCDLTVQGGSSAELAVRRAVSLQGGVEDSYPAKMESFPGPLLPSSSKDVVRHAARSGTCYAASSPFLHAKLCCSSLLLTPTARLLLSSRTGSGLMACSSFMQQLYLFNRCMACGLTCGSIACTSMLTSAV